MGEYSTMGCMQRAMQLLKNHRALLIVVVVHLIGGLLLLKLYRHQINPDGIAYVSLAADYAKGHFTEAINAYWRSYRNRPITDIVPTSVNSEGKVLAKCFIAQIKRKPEVNLIYRSN